MIFPAYLILSSSLLFSLGAPASPSGAAAGGLTTAAHEAHEPLALPAPARPASFVPIPGVRELSARLIVRPVQRRAYLDAGFTTEEAGGFLGEARRLLAAYELVRYVPQTDEWILRVPRGRTEQALSRSLLASGLFQYAEPDWIVYPSTLAPPAGPVQLPPQVPLVPQRVSTCPDDPLFAGQWYHSSTHLGSCYAWTLETGRPSVSIGVCDTGVRTTHEELQLHRLEAYNAVDRLWESEGGQIGPIHSHGTRTTGVVAANGNNGLGVSGVGWNLGHRMLRVSNQFDGGAQLSDLQHAARISIESGDRIASISYHGAYFASNLTTATYVKSLGGLMLWGAGNTSADYSFSNRDDDDLIVVGATDQNDLLASFSTYGSYIDLVAPGVGILTVDSAFDSDYATADGTSYSCPMAAGVCAMIWSARPTLSPNDVEAILKASALDIGAPGVDDLYGHGRIDLLAALQTNGSGPPTADFAAPLRSGLSPLTIEFTSLASGVPTSWLWDFGDGGSSTLPNPSHTYTQSGGYTVSLTVSNALGNDLRSYVDYILVDVIPPVAGFSATPTGGLSPLLVQFADESTGGVPTAWLWDFGDGSSSTLPNPSHLYAGSGYYTVSLTVTNPYGFDSLQRTDYVVVDFIPPVAAFSATPLSGSSPLVVQFTDESVGGVTTGWLWNFGDGTSSTQPNPVHTYIAPGNYSVRLTATNAYGNGELLKSGYISVGAGPPVLAEFSAAPLTGSAPLQVDFTDLSIGNVASWLWEFDDGTTSTLQNPTHVFATPGDYNIVLQVADPNGTDNSIEKEAYIVVQ